MSVRIGNSLMKHESARPFNKNVAFLYSIFQIKYFPYACHFCSKVSLAEKKNCKFVSRILSQQIVPENATETCQEREDIWFGKFQERSPIIKDVLC